MEAKSKTRPKRHQVASTAITRKQEPVGSDRPLKIGEAARAIGVEPYVLRFWETQFSFLRPRHSPSRHRSYDARDVDTLKLIKRLLHVEGFTIAGAKKHIRESGLEKLRAQGITAKPAKPAAADTAPVIIRNGDASEAKPRNLQRALAEIRRDLESLHKLL
ncbi:MAG TPA: MerR family transcriptional regulator [Candidatus Binataceae bacterium]|nr:MerR family transcriptional regulator [Candidatus Binataceae bacterium]